MEDAEVVLDVDVRFALRVEEVSEVPGRAEVGCSGIGSLDGMGVLIGAPRVATGFMLPKDDNKGGVFGRRGLLPDVNSGLRTPNTGFGGAG